MVEKINIVWLSYHQPEILARGYWDQGLLEETFKKGDFRHHTDFSHFETEDPEGAVVVINGRTHIEDAAQITSDIAKLKWCLFIVTGDEEALFPWRDVRHPSMRVWIMLPRMNQHDDTSFKLFQGYRPNTMELLKEIGQQERIYDWSFAGQVTHERRIQCIDEARNLPNGKLTETHTFGEEKVNYKQYLTDMAKSKIVLCPSGPETPDSFRLYEALEAGCLPIVDAMSTNHKAPGFWQYVFGNDIPFPIVDYWDKLPALLPELLKDYPRNANKAFAWWQQRKRSLYWKLIDDIRILHG